jgi:hypothetical protein
LLVSLLASFAISGCLLLRFANPPSLLLFGSRPVALGVSSGFLRLLLASALQPRESLPVSRLA